MTKRDAYFENLIEAVQLEKKAESDYYIQLSKDRTLEEKIERGIIWYPTVHIKTNFTIGEQVEWKFEKTRHLNLPHKLKVGMGCILYKSQDFENKPLKATISFIRKNKIAIVLSESSASKIHSSALSGNWCIELVFDEKPYRVMVDALKVAQKTNTDSVTSFKDALINGDASKETIDQHPLILNPSLNASQNEAIKKCIEAKYIGIIHGPPGTGKTTTLVGLLKNIAKYENKVLVTAPSNNAVDLLARKLNAAGLKVLRIGNVTRVSESTTELTLTEQSRNHPDWGHIKKIRIEAEEARRQAEKYKRHFGAKERAERQRMYQEFRELKRWAIDMEERIVQQVIQHAQFICTTLISASDKSIEDIKFDTCVIDEASQAMEPECWNVMIRSNRIILAGDHKQLSPTVKSQAADKLGLSTTLLDKLSEQIKHTHLLDTQYRMHEKILSFSNETFYDNQLKSSPTVKNHLLSDNDQPLCLIDTSGCGFEESFNQKNKSRYNEGEFYILREHMLQHISTYNAHNIGIISPYAEQVRFISDRIKEESSFSELDIEINSIDGFQGQEKDIIYISLVRSNTQGEIGFLKDARRLNVALTRARKKLIIIGDCATLCQHQLFDQLAKHIEAVGYYQSAWEYMRYE